MLKPRGGWGDGFGRVMLALIRSMMMLLAVISIADGMIRLRSQERSLSMLVFPIILLVGREVTRWEK